MEGRASSPSHHSFPALLHIPCSLFRVMRRGDGKVEVLNVPTEALPLDRWGREFLPEGWPRDRARRPRPAASQETVFALLGLPYLQEWEREAG